MSDGTPMAWIDWACDEDRNRILSQSVRSGRSTGGGWSAGGPVPAIEVDRGVAERGKPGHVGGVEQVMRRAFELDAARTDLDLGIGST